MKPVFVLTLAALLLGGPTAHSQTAPATAPQATLREAFADDFAIGVGLGAFMIMRPNTPTATLVAREFSSLTPENEMKWQSLHPAPDRFDFRAADVFVEFGAKNHMSVIGHTLVWHSQTPPWVFEGENGQPATREVLLRRMGEHIKAVMGRYQGKIKGWDVVNEAVSDNGPEVLRDSPWKRIIGEDFLDHAFRFAHEADPKTELYYNDYGLENPRKRKRALELLGGMIKRGVPINGVGLQGHYHLSQPSASEVEQTIKDFAALGLKVMITEMDVDVLPMRGPAGNADISRREQAAPALDPYQAGLPSEVQEQLARRYAELFDVFLRHRPAVTRVTLWGTDDGHSWLNHFPIRGRTNHALLFDRKLEPKPAYRAVVAKGMASVPVAPAAQAVPAKTTTP